MTGLSSRTVPLGVGVPFGAASCKSHQQIVAGGEAAKAPIKRLSSILGFLPAIGCGPRYARALRYASC